jgi:hypothetical protein
VDLYTTSKRVSTAFAAGDEGSDEPPRLPFDSPHAG